MEVTQKIKEWISSLRSTPHMLIGTQRKEDVTFEILCFYVDGFISGLDVALDKNIGEDMRIWFKQKYKIKSLPFPMTVYIQYEDGSDEEKKENLIENIDLFFQSLVGKMG